MNDTPDPFESKLRTVTPSPPPSRLRDRIEQELNPTPSLRWRIGVAAMIVSSAAAIVLIAALNAGPAAAPDAPDGNGLAAVDPDKKPLVLSFPIAEKPEPGPEGDWDPYLLQYLVPHADVILYGKVVRSEKQAEVLFIVHELLRGRLATLKFDATQERWRFGDCGPELAQWPVGQFCCVYLKYDAKEKTYCFVDTGVPIQRLPYKGALGIDALREIIRVWDASFAGKTKAMQLKQRAAMGERGRLIHDVVTNGYRVSKEAMEKLNAMIVEENRDRAQL